MVNENRKVEIEAFQKKITIERVIGHVEGNKSHPTVIAIAGIHGNEQAGVYALHNVCEAIRNQDIQFKGNFYALSGNLNALKQNIRFEKFDLNRIWTQESTLNINKDINGFDAEVNEQIALYNIIKDILSRNNGSFYFIDLHTTSSPTKPFITISDSLNNRQFTSNFSVPIVLGIEEFLDGPLLTFVNEFGHVALGFEGGEHYAEQSIVNCEAFIWLSLVITKCLSKGQVKNFDLYKHLLCEKRNTQDFYAIKFKYAIKNNEAFSMNNGFKNFDAIEKYQLLAHSNGKKIKAIKRGKIFMPLYQKQGDDGFFIINSISKFWLNLSKIVRKLKLYHLLRILPGIKMDPSNAYTLIVNPKTARFLAIEIFHLFGYRKQVIKDNKLHFIKRDRKISDF